MVPAGSGGHDGLRAVREESPTTDTQIGSHLNRAWARSAREGDRPLLRTLGEEKEEEKRGEEAEKGSSMLSAVGTQRKRERHPWPRHEPPASTTAFLRWDPAPARRSRPSVSVPHQSPAPLPPASPPGPPPSSTHPCSPAVRTFQLPERASWFLTSFPS